VRIEAPSQAFLGLTDLTPDPRLFLERESGLFRTYAFVTGGRIVVEDGPQARIGVKPGGGRSETTSFSLLWQPVHSGLGPPVQRRQPLTSPLSYLCGGLRPHLGKTSEIGKGASDTAQATAADLREHWPPEYWEGLEDFLRRLERLGADLRAQKSYVHSPAIERQWTYALDASGRAQYPGLFLAGDGAGVSQGAMAAAISGVAAGQTLGERSRLGAIDKALDWQETTQ
jgi:hypothetical protein